MELHYSAECKKGKRNKRLEIVENNDLTSLFRFIKPFYCKTFRFPLIKANFLFPPREQQNVACHVDLIRTHQDGTKIILVSADRLCLKLSLPADLRSTGTTGYIGGDALKVFTDAHPDWEITCLVRNSSKGAKVAAQYPKVRLVYGDLDATDLITEEANKADIVYRKLFSFSFRDSGSGSSISDFANCDHEASSHAIAKGLSERSEPSHWIHTSGTGILCWETMDKECYGEVLPKVYNDLDGVNELVTMPDHAWHRVVDKIVLACSASNPQVKTAIVCPPTIYGPGRGPDNQRSVQAYGAAKQILESKKGFIIGNGKNVWHEVHVQDLSDLYLLLGEAAVSSSGKATWNEQGYYLAENGSFVWGDIFRSITKIAHEKGLIPSADAPSMAIKDVTAISPFLTMGLGTNSRGLAQRGRTLLGWKPYRRSLNDELADIVEGEARALGMIQGHAAKVEQ